jgi:hypothetical protein
MARIGGAKIVLVRDQNKRLRPALQGLVDAEGLMGLTKEIDPPGRDN